MSWFLFAIAGYFLYSVVTVTNKFLLRQPATTKPLAFTFWIGVLSVFTFVLAPFGLHWPGWGLFAYDIFVGITFFLALLTFYWALDVNEASRTASVVGGLIPVFVFPFAYLFLNERLGWLQILAFFILVLGGLSISLKIEKGVLKEGLRSIKVVFLAILLGAIYWVAVKYAFGGQGFVTGFVWTRLGLVLAALLVLLWPAWRRQILNSIKQATGGLSALMVSSKLLAGFGSLFVHLSLSRASASLIQALQGTEYVFLLILTAFLSKKFPQILREKLSRGIIFQKIAAVLLIGVGLLILAI
jgi:drug/metabolite transporter (DMT)-like permease